MNKLGAILNLIGVISSIAIIALFALMVWFHNPVIAKIQITLLLIIVASFVAYSAFCYNKK